MHGHGRGTHLGTYLVHQQCVSCVVASAACVTTNKCCVLFFISLHLLCTGMDEARTLWYMPCAIAVCLVCPHFAACFSVFISWLGGGMHEACGSAHGQCTPRVAWPLLQASPVLDGVVQRHCTHANSAMV